MAHPLKSPWNVRMILAASIVILCACRADGPHQKQIAPTQSKAMASASPAVPAATQATTDTTTLQAGQKPAPGTTTSTGEVGPPPQDTPAATGSTPVAVTGTHLAPPP